MRVVRWSWLWALLSLVGCSAVGGGPPQDPSDLPRVLLIGDSISIGYTPFVRAQLEGLAEVTHNAGNAGHTGRGLARLDEWLSEGPFDLIHFNWGLWDLAYRPDGSKERGLDRKNGTQSWPVDAYVEHLIALTDRLDETGALLIWASTTPVPQGEPGRFAGDAARYNEAARAVMEVRDIPINDLHGLVSGRLEELQRPANVHFTEHGSAVLGAQVAAVIQEALAWQP